VREEKVVQANLSTQEPGHVNLVRVECAVKDLFDLQLDQKQETTEVLSQHMTG
jgi:hypothetical protein